jgi:type I restriction enzyme M protein
MALSANTRTTGGCTLRSAAPKNYANFIWNIADLLRGSYRPHQYGSIILPFTVLRRIDAVLDE